MQHPVLLVGNDINNISKGQSWKDLLQEILVFCGTECVQLDDKKPFPLLYEEIFLTAIRQSHIREKELKTFIASKVGAIAPNELHGLIRELQPEHILTTNYEYTLEGGAPAERNSLVSERSFSIFRRYTQNGTNFWHIHGDCQNPMSINLGFEHYGGQLQQMRNYVVSGTTYTTKFAPKLPLLRRIKQGPLKEHSWLDLFFTRDIHIFGLSLDFVETDLWWLLTYRARQKFQHNTIQVPNKLYYYIPAEFVKASGFKLDMLTANDVQIVSISAKSKLAYYKEVLARVKKA
ncbi:MAG TPA: SIR2 family protein [Chitinophaga sp.]